MTPLDILRGARELLAKPEAWHQGSSARTSTGSTVNTMSPHACAFCIIGALCRVSGGQPLDEDVISAALKLPVDDPISFNDDPKTTHADVLALLDKGIAQSGGNQCLNQPGTLSPHTL